MVIQELKVTDIHTVRAAAGTTTVTWVHGSTGKPDEAQKHLRSSPEAFLARRIFVGEGRTEYGLIRGLDALWSAQGAPSLAYQGVAAIAGGGVSEALQIARHLLDLGYDTFVLLDSDEAPVPEQLQAVTDRKGTVLVWPDDTSTEQRLFLDAPWALVEKLVEYAAQANSADRVLHTINEAAALIGHPQLGHLNLAEGNNTPAFRAVLGSAAGTKNKSWYKTIDKAEEVAALIFPYLPAMATTPFALGVKSLRVWVDG